MKKLIITLIIMVSLFGGGVNAHQDNEYPSLMNDMAIADLRWRRPDLEFIVVRENNKFSLLIKNKSDGSIIWDSSAMSDFGTSAIWYAQDKFIRQRMFNPWSYYIIPIIPSIVKVTMDFTNLPIGFKILNPDNGLIEERWDGSTWLRPNQLSQKDFSLGATGPVE